MAKLESLGIKTPRGHPLLRARPRAQPPLLHAGSWTSPSWARRRRSWRSAGKQQSAVFQAGDVVLVVEPAGRRGRARVALPAQAPRRRRHAGLRGGGHRAARSGCSRSAAARPSPTSSASRTTGGTLRDVLHHHAVRRHHLPLRASATATARCSRASQPHAAPQGGKNRFGFGQIDHVTSNFQTMKPTLLWMEHVLGFEEFWEVAVPHRRRDGAAAAGPRLGAALDRDVGSGERA